MRILQTELDTFGNYFLIFHKRWGREFITQGRLTEFYTSVLFEGVTETYFTNESKALTTPIHTRILHTLNIVTDCLPPLGTVKSPERKSHLLLS